jgi:hypothetical protein
VLTPDFANYQIESVIVIRNLLLIVLLASSRLSASCVLHEGVGAVFGKIGVAKQSFGTVPPGVDMLYENYLLTQIFVHGGECRTSKGIGIGDPSSEVHSLYGRGRKTVLYLEKGKGERIGQVGEYVLEYSGVAFAITNDKVSAIFIEPERGVWWSGSMNWALDMSYALIGLALIYWAKPLSIRYNAWTTGLRARHPNFNPPPTPEWWALNTQIMTVIFRVCGLSLFLFLILHVYRDYH